MTGEEGLQAGLVDEVSCSPRELTEEDIVEWASNFLSSDRLPPLPQPSDPPQSDKGSSGDATPLLSCDVV
jgi:hypothetical protein